MKTCLLWLLAIPLLVITLLGLFGALPGGDGVVAQRNLPDGTQLLVTQTSVGFEYEIGFYLKSPNSDWGWCYLDHEDPQWRFGRIDYDEVTGVATVWNGSTLRGRFTPRTRKWEPLDDYGNIGRSITAPDALKNPPYMP